MLLLSIKLVIKVIDNLMESAIEFYQILLSLGNDIVKYFFGKATKTGASGRNN